MIESLKWHGLRLIGLPLNKIEMYHFFMRTIRKKNFLCGQRKFLTVRVLYNSYHLATILAFPLLFINHSVSLVLGCEKLNWNHKVTFEYNLCVNFFRSSKFAKQRIKPHHLTKGLRRYCRRVALLTGNDNWIQISSQEM